MNRYFWVGLLMNIFNLLGILLYLSREALSKVSIGVVIGGTMWFAYTIVSIIFLIKGLFKEW